MTGRPAPPATVDTQASAARARAIVMATERRLGFEPTDRELDKLGYDIESRVPATGALRFLEVKGRRSDAETITVTRNEILYSPYLGHLHQTGRSDRSPGTRSRGSGGRTRPTRRPAGCSGNASRITGRKDVARHRVAHRGCILIADCKLSRHYGPGARDIRLECCSLEAATLSSPVDAARGSIPPRPES